MVGINGRGWGMGGRKMRNSRKRRKVGLKLGRKGEGRTLETEVMGG